MACEKERVDELLQRWRECLDEMAGTEYDCSFDCGSHQGEEGYCYHGRLFKEEEERATKILEELIGISNLGVYGRSMEEHYWRNQGARQFAPTGGYWQGRDRPRAAGFEWAIPAKKSSTLTARLFGLWAGASSRFTVKTVSGPIFPF